MSHSDRSWIAASATRAFAILIAITFISLVALAQTETGQLVGTVRDPNGAVVPNAAVTLKSVETGRTQDTVANQEGVYTVTNLQPGLYAISATAQGFSPATQRVQITVGSRTTVDLNLAVGEVKGETVNV